MRRKFDAHKRFASPDTGRFIISKILPSAFIEALKHKGVKFFAGVPDSLLKEVIRELSFTAEDSMHVTCANEGNAVAVATGYHLATGEIALVYMQNSGLGNAVNPLSSLCHERVYKIPMLLLIGWRGEPGKEDEPQHIAMGEATLAMLATLNIPFKIVDEQADINDLISEAINQAKEKSAPVALVCKSGIFSQSRLPAPATPNHRLSRSEAISAIAKAAGDDTFFICTTGFIGRELYKQRLTSNLSHDTDFLNAGSMGHASQIGLGVALARPDKQITILDGDGACIMHMGGLAAIGKIAPKNLKHIVLKNGMHESVGGQPTAAGYDVDFVQIAKACGYDLALSTDNLDGLNLLLAQIYKAPTLAFLEICIGKSENNDLPRPEQTFAEMKSDFARKLRMSSSS